MSDVNWRDIEKDRSIFQEENKHRRIIAQTTNDLIWDSFASYVDCNTYVLKECDYKVERYAYYS